MPNFNIFDLSIIFLIKYQVDIFSYIYSLIASYSPRLWPRVMVKAKATTSEIGQMKSTAVFSHIYSQCAGAGHHTPCGGDTQKQSKQPGVWEAGILASKGWIKCPLVHARKYDWFGWIILWTGGILKPTTQGYAGTSPDPLDKEGCLAQGLYSPEWGGDLMVRPSRLCWFHQLMRQL